MLTIRNMKKTANSICNSKKRINYLGMSLTKVAKSRYSEKHKMLLKGTNKWKGARVPGTGGGHVDHPKAIDGRAAIPTKTSRRLSLQKEENRPKLPKHRAF